MARLASALPWMLALLGACDDAPGPRVIPIPDGGAPDAGPPDAAPVDASPDAAPPVQITLDTTPIAACDAPSVALPITVSAPVEVVAIVGDVRGEPVRLVPGEPLEVDLRAVPEGVRATAIEVEGRRVAGPDVAIDRTPPTIDWPAVDAACVDVPPAPVFDEPVDWQLDAGRLGCRVIHRVEATDACGLRSIARRAWRVGPPGRPTVSGETAFRWILAPDDCSDEATATLGRVGEPPVEYTAGTAIEWPGAYELTLTVTGCNGPVEWAYPVEIPPGPCDAITRPLDTAPRVRGWLEITADRLFELSVGLSADDVALGATIREAATLLAGHPGFPDACPRQPCSTAVERQRALAALELAAEALDGRSGARAARRCVAEAARVVVEARSWGEEACEPAAQAESAALVDAWISDPAARARVGCLCGGCPADAACADAPVLVEEPDPVRFADQIARLGGPAATRCAVDGDCAALVAATDAALAEEDCTARTLLSVTRLLVGRRCAGVGRFRHPGLLALDAALARWPLWDAAGTAGSRADLATGAALCAPP